MTMTLTAVLFSSMVFAEEPADPASDPEVLEYVVEESEEEIKDDLMVVRVNLSEEGEVILEDYSSIEIPEDTVTVNDSDIDSYIYDILSYSTTTEFVTEGIIEMGDTVNIDFSGRLATQEEPFDGGTAQGYELVLGSGTFIEGFEDQLAGHEIGETFDIYVTFPENYTEELAGQDAVFTITINYKTITVVPELTDAFVQEFSVSELGEELNTVDELREYTYNYLYNSYLKNAIMNVMQSKVNVITYPEEQFHIMKAYSEESLSYYSAMYSSYGLEGYDEDMIAQMSGFASADDYSNDEAMYYMNLILLLDNVAEEQGISYTDEEVNQAIEDYMLSYGYNTIYSVEEFKEMSGEAWVLLISKLQVEYEKVMDVLVDHVVFVASEAIGE